MKVSLGGYTQVPNEMLEFLMTQELTALEFRICIYFIRQLTGWNYEYKPFQIAQISLDLREDDEKKIIKALSNLVKKNILKKTKVSGYRTNLYAFNKETIGRVLIGKAKPLYKDGGKVINLETFKLVKVRNLTLSEVQSLHSEGGENDTLKTRTAATIADSEVPKDTEIHINTLLRGDDKKLTWERVREILLKKFPNDSRRLDKTYAQIKKRGYEQEGKSPFIPKDLLAWFLSRYESFRHEYAFHDERRA